MKGKPDQGRVWLMIGYVAMILATVGLFLVVRNMGSGLTAPAPAGGSTFGQGGEQAHGGSLVHVLIALAAIIIASRLTGDVFKHFHQPPVIGEVLAGIMLGPSLLGQFAPGAVEVLFPKSIIPLLGTIAQVGVLLFMFLIGLELNTSMLREQSHAALAISHASIVAPFALGSILALWLYPVLSSSDVPFTAFALFLGVAMSVTAFPVLARILTDRRLQRTRMGTIALTCAAVDDATAWCLLAFVVGVVNAKLGGAMLTILMTLGYIGLMFGVVRPLIRKWVDRFEDTRMPAQPMMATAFIGLLLSSIATEYIGIHALFGAFLLGAIIPHDSRVARTIHEKLEDFVIVMLLPAFFAFTGLRTQVGLIQGPQWLYCGLIILVACAGKFGGTLIAARLTGLGWRDSSALGILMNTRGLMGLIVLNIGLDLKVISPTLFAMFVLMALVTTLMTTPILDRLTQGATEKETGWSGLTSTV